MINISDKRILKVMPWTPMCDIPSVKSAKAEELRETYALPSGKNKMPGVYQVINKDDVAEIGDNLIHEKIGYTGKTGNAISRFNHIKPLGGSHGVRCAINREALQKYGVNSIDDLLIRFLATKNQNKVENEIHEARTAKFGFKFNWREASLGKEGYYIQATEYVSKYLNSHQCLELVKFCGEQGRKKCLEEFDLQMSAQIDGK